jgi:mono/diheme cytochrome c family protein
MVAKHFGALFIASSACLLILATATELFAQSGSHDVRDVSVPRLAYTKSQLKDSPSQQQQIDTTVRSALADHVRTMMDGLSKKGRAGYKALVGNVYLPHDFDESVVAELIDEDWRSEFAAPESFQQASDQKSSKRWETLRAFGISPRPNDRDKPLQYVKTPDGRWVMNCFACHGGSTYGVPFPGAPNTTYALESLTEQVRRIKLKKKLPLAHMDIGSIAMPLGTTIGTSNAVMFGVALMNYRDRDLNIFPLRPPPSMAHHDMDAPAWWQFQRKTHMYADGFAEKGHKGLMQFMLVKQNGPEQFRAWERDFKNVYAFLSEVKPPRYPLAIDAVAADRGRMVFRENCTQCHGSYEPTDRQYPELNVDIDDVGTDPLRFTSLTPLHRKNYGNSWFTDYGRQQTFERPAGYTAPPLDGIWVTAPYFHNGSVPTLRAVLFPEERPVVWRRQSESFNEQDVGFDYHGSDELPADYGKLKSFQKRYYFDTRKTGKSNQGHDYPALLSPEQRQDLLEYLKTL